MDRKCNACGSYHCDLTWDELCELYPQRRIDRAWERVVDNAHARFVCPEEPIESVLYVQLSVEDEAAFEAMR